MNIPGLVQSYDSRVSSAAGTRSVMAPQYIHNHPYSGAPPNGLLVSHQQIQHNPFSFQGYSTVIPNGVMQPFASNYIQQRPLPRLMQPDMPSSRAVPFSPNNRTGFVQELQTHSPPIKPEPRWSVPASSPSFSPGKIEVISTTLPASGSTEANFGTEVDTLMKAIQAKSQSVPPQSSSPSVPSKPVVGVSVTPPYAQSVPQGGVQDAKENKFKLTREDVQDDAVRTRGGKRRYHCTIEDCTKSFYQKTHLEIHERKHTGIKPYPCKEPGCGRSFSQLGNLKTHERRHTGERPYQCDTCGKRFAQRGNVRAHKTVHNQSKPYLCRLDECGKKFTQLGNLKSHQNKFHIASIRNLTAKFGSIKDGDIVNAADKDLWEYFANLYKNSNKGIKGRGKDRRVGPHPEAMSSSMRKLGVSVGRGYSFGGAGRGNIAVREVGAGMRGDDAGGEDAPYEMFDGDDESQSGSHSRSGCGSSVGTCYDDGPSDGYEDRGRTVELAFGDRIY